MKTLKSAGILAMILLMVFALTACGGSTENASASTSTPAASSESTPAETTPAETSEPAAAEEITVNVSGSTSVLPLAQEEADAFEAKYPNVRVNVNGGGSSQGVKDVVEGISDIGNTSRNLKDSEKEFNLNEHVIAYDGIAVSVHPSNPVTSLSKEQVQGIFKGEITNWKDVGGNDEEIVVISREDGSGTRGAFEEILKLEDESGSLVSETALIFNGNGGVKAALASKETAIGYLSLGVVDESVKPLEIDGVAPSVETIKAGDYPVSRPFLMNTPQETTEGAQMFIDFILSDEGQAIVEDGYITVK
ncbi:phosphate ABC transporter substrate-binding protein PstS family protein [Fusibacter paucivorans]|uniref:Phosphate-binding protein n=1 Tax=Fusibacter paucivorans TaxID=76009 RepID=A0ABS5PML4_9FIRM|nr:phosphate ABC transporter substrate-binding protein [Fusibacter paucivorans]MBS7526419.1 phosphate ABC transporter substrate-binding protein PstS family protein [Fusibacter paucivorans]